MQSKILDSQRWLSTTIASVHDALIAVDSAYRIITMNQAAERLTGWTEANAHGRIFTQVYTTCDAHTGEDLPTPIHLALQSGETVSRKGKAVLIARGAKVFPVDETASLIVDEIRGVQGAVLVFQDASERVDTETEYRDDLVPAVFDSLAALLIVTDADGKIIRLNEKARTVLGKKDAEVLDKYFWDLCSNSEDSGKTSESFKSLNGVGNEMSFDCCLKTESKGDKKFRWCNSAIREDSDEISYILCTGIEL
jgi:PAS domain S-box-containing protein